MSTASIKTIKTVARAVSTRDRYQTPPWLQALHERAANHFAELGFPTRKHEEWKYTSLRELTAYDFDLANAPTEQADDRFEQYLQSVQLDGHINIVFVDGVFQRQLSSDAEVPGLRIQDLRSSILDHGDVVRPLLDRPEYTNGNPFISLNQAFVGDGALIQISGKVDRPLNLIHIASRQEGARVTFPRHVIVANSDAEATIQESYGGVAQNPYLINSVSDIHLAPGARLSHLIYQQGVGDHTRHNECGWHQVHSVKVEVGADASYSSSLLSISGKMLRNNIDVRLTAPGAAADLSGAYLVKGREHLDNNTVISHLAPHTQSQQLYKGVLDDRGRAVFSGKVIVDRIAQQTSAQQMNKNLLLSSDAEVDSKPQLQIDADDVKCSHGATTGSLHHDELFYLTTRGIPEAQAKVMLTRAFIEETLLSLSDGQHRALAQRLLDSYFESR